MKKALVVIEEFMGRSIGDIDSIGEASDIDSRSGHLYSKMLKVEIPSSLENFPLKAVYLGNEETSPEFWFKDGLTVSENPQDESYNYHPATVSSSWNIILDLDAYKILEVSKLYESLNAEVYAQMETVFGTKSSDSANADERTYHMLLEDPAFYAGNGLFAKVATASYTKGQVLDTSEEISGYATEMIASIKDYALWRKVRERDFIIKKAAIENA